MEAGTIVMEVASPGLCSCSPARAPVRARPPRLCDVLAGADPTRCAAC